MSRAFCGILFCLVFVSGAIHAADSTSVFRVMFWNTENFFDPFDDSLTADEEYLPGHIRGWNYTRYKTKRNNVYKVISTIGAWSPPELVGLAEIENRQVLNDLIYKTPLVQYDYRIIHAESPDPRGIDVALLYRKSRFRLICQEFISVKLNGSLASKTRDILYACGMAQEDTLHVFVNHWPSRLGGQIASDERRCLVASILKAKTDSILVSSPSAKIIIIGDFNDEPTDKSLTHCLGAAVNMDEVQPGKLYNLSSLIPRNEPALGTHKFQGDWAILDQVIVSGGMIKTPTGFSATPQNVRIYAPSFLLERDDAWFGYKPYRTYNGMKYQGGFSDHLPVLLELKDETR